jgi:hypothetical protein
MMVASRSTFKFKLSRVRLQVLPRKGLSALTRSLRDDSTEGLGPQPGITFSEPQAKSRSRERRAAAAAGDPCFNRVLSQA